MSDRSRAAYLSTFLGENTQEHTVLETDVDDMTVANYPNPFNPVTVIAYRLLEPGRVRLAIYDVLGRQVAVLVNGHAHPGRHTATFDGAGLASGIYLVRLEADGTTRTLRITLMK